MIGKENIMSKKVIVCLGLLVAGIVMDAVSDYYKMPHFTQEQMEQICQEEYIY